MAGWRGSRLSGGGDVSPSGGAYTMIRNSYQCLCVVRVFLLVLSQNPCSISQEKGSITNGFLSSQLNIDKTENEIDAKRSFGSGEERLDFSSEFCKILGEPSSLVLVMILALLIGVCVVVPVNSCGRGGL